MIYHIIYIIFYSDEILFLSFQYDFYALNLYLLMWFQSRL